MSYNELKNVKKCNFSVCTSFDLGNLSPQGTHNEQTSKR